MDSTMPRDELRSLLDSHWEDRRLPSRSAPSRPRTPFQRLRHRLFEQLIRELESSGRGPGSTESTRRKIDRLVDESLSRPGAPLIRPGDRRRLEDSLFHDVEGFGPLEPLLVDPTVSDILVNGPAEIWVDRFGRLERTHQAFDDAEHLQRLLSRVVTAHGRRLDEGSPTVDVRLPDGSRLHAVLPPISPVITVSIRRRRKNPLSMDDLLRSGTLDLAMARFLEEAVVRGADVVISGGAATGKTTLLNVLASAIPPTERVVTIEETAELTLDHPHVVALEARLPNVEGRGEVDLRTLLKNALRMRPDRILVGEVRGPEVFDMLQAMNTGHDGSSSTVHANSPEDALRRLENLVHLGGFQLPSTAVREMLGAAIDLLVHIDRFPDGSRRVTSVQEVLLADGRIETRELFGSEAPTGRQPTSRTLPRIGQAIVTNPESSG